MLTAVTYVADMIHRLRMVMESHDGSVKASCRKRDLGLTTIREWFKGTRDPSLTTFIRTLNKYNLTVEIVPKICSSQDRPVLKNRMPGAEDKHAN